MPEERKISPGAVVAIGLGLGGIAVLGLAALAFASPPTPPGKARLYGVVTDATTGKPIDGVTVSLWDTFIDPETGIVIPGPLTTYTHDGGNYLFPNVEPGEYLLEFSKEGYETATY